MDEIFDKLDHIHHSEDIHCGIIRLYKHIVQHYHGITEEICGFYVSTCQTCYLKKAKKSIKSIVTKPIKSTDYLSRGQVDLVDLSDMNPVMNVSPDGKTPYKYLLVYIDHFTKKLSLAPLINKTAYEVCEALLDIFCEQGPPHILHSDNGREFCNELLFSMLESNWPSVKIVHGKPRHSETQGAVERVNREVKDALFSMMHDNNDQCWVKYLRWIKYNHNTAYHTTIKTTPYEAVYGRNPFGLSHFAIPNEFWGEIKSEADLFTFIEKVSISI